MIPEWLLLGSRVMLIFGLLLLGGVLLLSRGQSRTGS
jgi:hypothetical protein